MRGYSNIFSRLKKEQFRLTCLYFRNFLFFSVIAVSSKFNFNFPLIKTDINIQNKEANWPRKNVLLNFLRSYNVTFFHHIMDHVT
jgi:hypothetical protein